MNSSLISFVHCARTTNSISPNWRWYWSRREWGHWRAFSSSNSIIYLQLMKHGVRWRSMRRNSTLGTSRRIQKIKNPSHHQGQSVKRKCSSALQNYSVNSRFLQTLVMSKFRTKLKSQSHQTSPNYMPSMKMSVGVPLLSLWRMKVILLL